MADNGSPPKPAADAADREWVRAAVARFERPLISYAAHLANSLDVGRDVAQETFVRLCSADRAQVEGRLAQWLFTVCRNLAIDYRRKERRMSLFNPETETETFASDGPSPDDAAERDDSVSLVLRRLGELPPVQQEVVRLKFQHGLSYRQIGEVLNLTPTNVGFLLHTAIKSLRTKLTDPADAPARGRS